jgi:hypothetical protein
LIVGSVRDILERPDRSLQLLRDVQRHAEILESALDVDADRMVNSIAKDDLDSGMTVVRNEVESREKQPVARAVRALRHVNQTRETA